MWQPRCLSADGASISYMGRTSPRGGCPRKKPRDQEVAAAAYSSDVAATQYLLVCHRTATADTQLLEPSGGSGSDHENRHLWGVPRVRELCLPTNATPSSAIAGISRAVGRLSQSDTSRAVGRLSQSDTKKKSCVEIRVGSLFLITLDSTCTYCARKAKICSFVSLVLFVFSSPLVRTEP